METIVNSIDTTTFDKVNEQDELVGQTVRFSETEPPGLYSALTTRISNVLQTTLDVNALIGLYSAQIKPAVPHLGVYFFNEDAQFSVNIGRESEFRQRFNLYINNDQLGTITVHRDWNFNKEELKILQFSLHNLLYPLRNALLYRDALQRAVRDPLTGVYNRSTFEETLARETKLACRGSNALSLIVLDIDHFKSVNDSFGHSVGDCVIKAIAEKTVACIRSTDIVFRYGGEEFVIILSNTDINGVKQLAERIRKAIEITTTRCGEVDAKVTASLGIAEFSKEENGNSFFTRADSALYRAKENGRNRVEIG